MFDYAVHSDLLVYWTGRIGIDAQYDPDWYQRNRSNTDYARVSEDVEELRRRDPEAHERYKVPTKADLKQLEEEYLRRLTSILEHGLWMTTPSDTDKEPDSEVTLYFNKERCVHLPEEVARVCFTELRLSQARTHAKRYGRLGIGVKRPFLLDRGGRPVIYLGPKVNRERDAFFSACDRLFQHADRDLLHFLKPMNSSKRTQDDLYAESEWRIIHTGNLLDPAHARAGYPDTSHEGRCSGCVKANVPERPFLDSLTKENRQEAERRLRYLLPLDGWLSCIIYPSVSLKRQALDSETEMGKKIRKEIQRIKSDPDCRANDVENGNLPVEMDLDLCRNF